MKRQIAHLSALLHSGEISSEELTEKYIDKIEKEDALLNAYVHTNFENARKAAREADKRLKEGSAGILCGIPMALKDNICTEGLLTECCSKMLKGYTPFYSAAVWEKLSSQGAVLLGKTNMDEFAMGSTSETSCYGAPLNPVNRDYVAGGSSGGSAAAVAADLAVYALGSDTGGSVRQPAAFCGTVGLKPTYGAVSRYGLIAYASSMDQIGVLSSSVEDAAIVFDAIKGRDSRDMTTWEAAYKNTGSCFGDGSKSRVEICTEKFKASDYFTGKKIGLAHVFFDGADDEVKKSVMAVVDFCRQNGAEIVEAELPMLKTALSAYYIIACAEASSNLGRYDGIRYGSRAEDCENFKELILKSRSKGFGSEVKKRIMLGTYVLSGGYYDEYYKKACLIRNETASCFKDIFRKCDFIFAPTSPVTAFKSSEAGGSICGTEMYLADIATVPASIAGIPSVSIPVGTDKNGLPIGMQIMGNRFCEDVILKTAHVLERLYGQQENGNKNNC